MDLPDLLAVWFIPERCRRYPSPAFAELGMDVNEELKSAGVYPTGPVSAWPQERHERLMAEAQERLRARYEANPVKGIVHRTLPAKESGQRPADVKMPGIGKMAKGLVTTAGQAITNGKVSREIRDERYATCQACPSFNPESKRCGECGCFMQAKTWIAGNKSMLCPLDKWDR